MSIVLPLPDDLKGRVETALAREYYKVPSLRTVTPQIWRSNARKKAVTLAIQATTVGDEIVPGGGVYMLEVSVSVQARATKLDASKLIAEVEKVHQDYGLLYINGDAAGYDDIFNKYQIKVYGALPKVIPATIENLSRIEFAGLTMWVCKL